MPARLVRKATRLVDAAAVMGALGHLARAILERRNGRPYRSAPPGGSFDSWPAVPQAPGRAPR